MPLKEAGVLGDPICSKKSCSAFFAFPPILKGFPRFNVAHVWATLSGTQAKKLEPRTRPQVVSPWLGTSRWVTRHELNRLFIDQCTVDV